MTTLPYGFSPEKMTFLTANYGLTQDQVVRFWQAYNEAYQSMAGEIEYAWQEGGWTPDRPEDAMIECLVDADRLEQFIPDYMDWCFDFRFKMELVYDLEDRIPPQFLQDYLTSQGKTWWTAQAA